MKTRPIALTSLCAFSWFTLGLFIALSLLGCGGGTSTSTAVPVAWSGTVTAAAHPLAGAQVSLYAAGNTRTTPPALLAQTLTNSQGQFVVTSVSSLPDTGQMVYAVATASNAAIKLMAVMGAYCAPSTACDFAPQITLNELTTVASTFSLAPYLTNTASKTVLVSVAGNSQALQNSAATANSLVNPATGVLSTPLAALRCSDVPILSPADAKANNCKAVLRLNTLSNLMASCTGASSASAVPCAQWLGLGTEVLDTLGVLLQIATQSTLRNNGTAVFSATPPLPIYLPALSAAPTDWSLALNFSGGGLNGPVSLAIDATGHVWVSNNLQGGSLSKFNPDGSAVSPSGGFVGNGLLEPQGLAVDAVGRVWVTNWAQGSGSTLSIFNPDGSAASGSPVVSTRVNGVASIAGPVGVALSPSGSLWVANYGNSTLSAFTSSQLLQVGPVTGAGLSFPVNVTVDNQGNVWTVNNSNSTVSEFTAAGLPVQSSAYKSPLFNAPNGAALTSSGNLWVTNQLGNSLTQLVGGNTPPTSCPSPVLVTSTGCVLNSLPSSPSSGPSFKAPTQIAIDGKGNLWVSNEWSASLSLISSGGALLSPQAGYQAPGMSQPSGVAIDASGNVWVLNYGSNTLTKFIGIAAPVATPRQGQPTSL